MTLATAYTRCARAQNCHYKISRKKYARDPSFSVLAARCGVLEPPSELRRSLPAREILRRSSSTRRDPSFFNRPVRYDVLQPAAEIRRSAAQPSNDILAFGALPRSLIRVYPASFKKFLKVKKFSNAVLFEKNVRK